MCEMRNPWTISVVSSAVGVVMTQLCLVATIMCGSWFAIAMCMVDAVAVAVMGGYCVSEWARWQKAKAQFDKMMQIADEFEKERAE